MESQPSEETRRDDTAARRSWLCSFSCGLFPSPSSSAEAAEAPHYAPRVFTFNDLKIATRGFGRDNLLGRGVFGIVFLGWIEEHGTAPTESEMGLAVAVRVLQKWLDSNNWLLEVLELCKLRHPNVAKVIGYCSEGQDMVLVYEYMDLRSLEDNLFRRTSPLPWIVRLKIAVGAAKGLAFLHGRMITFRDLKASKILLDSEYNAKLQSDFGLVREGGQWGRSCGSLGYVAPEYSLTEPLTPASDVYAFGVVLLELFTGTQAFNKSRTRGKESLVEGALPFLAGDNNRVLLLVDPNLGRNFSPEAASTAFCLAGRCLSEDPRVRPAMQEVVDILAPLENLRDTASSAFISSRIRVFLATT